MTAYAQLVEGVISTDVTLPDSQKPFRNLYLASDVSVDSGATVTILPGTTVYCAPSDSGNIGFDDQKVELIVHGTLLAEGSADSHIVFRSAKDSPTEGDWWGIVAYGPFSHVSYAEVMHADYGIILASDTTTVLDNSQFTGNALIDIWVTPESDVTVIRDNIVRVGGGIGMYVLAADEVVGNTLIGDGDTDIGIHYTSISDSTAIIADNAVDSISVGIGIKLEAGSTRLSGNQIEHGAVGFDVRNGWHQIGTTDDQSDNMTDQVTTAVHVVRGGPGGLTGCPLSSVLDLSLRNNQFSNYTDGLIVERSPKNGPAPLDAGTSISGAGQGRNQFSNDEETPGARAIDAATSSCDTVRARANYFNEFAGSIDGKVDTTGTFADPLGAALVRTEPVPAKAPPIRVKGAFPNPTTGTIRFDIEASGDGMDIEIEVVDVLGRLVRRLQPQRLSRGLNAITWNGSDNSAGRVANGIYFVRVRHDEKLVGALRIVVAR